MRHLLYSLLALWICSCSHVMPPGPVKAPEDLDSALVKRREDYARAAVEQLKRRKKQRVTPRKAEVAWDEELRKSHIDRSRQSEQFTVDEMPTAILRPQKTDPEEIPASDGTPEFESTPALEDSEHAVLHHYRDGMARIEARDWDAAISAFTKFVDEQPGHIYADRAAYWISHAHYMAGDHGLAIVTSNQFEARYPHSPRLPEAIYYRALSHLELGQYEEAAPELRSLLSKFPSSTLAVDASKKLAEINVQREVRSP